jgi:hypothetical protein
MPTMCEECKCSVWVDQGCDNGCTCCNGPKFFVKVFVEFSGEIHADSAEEAEKVAWEKWGTDSDSEISYFGIQSIHVEEA